MSLLDGILQNVAGAPDDVTNLAQKVGIPPAMAEMAIAALAKAHPMQGDTVQLASAQTGLESSVLTAIVEHIGGEGSLSEFSRMIQDHPEAASIFKMLDQDGDGNPVNDIAGMASNLFGKK